MPPAAAAVVAGVAVVQADLQLDPRSDLPAALDTQLQRDAELTFFECMVLSVLSQSPDRTRRMSDLAALASASLSRLSHVVSASSGAATSAAHAAPAASAAP